jgi:molecular chaperone HtpG
MGGPTNAMTEAQSTPPLEHASELPFQAEVREVLALVIDSLYTNREVFLRELVSNASDALDKARFFQMSTEGALPQEGEPRIVIRADDEAHTITIEDNGIGMTRDEVVEHLGTIAKSGTRAFLDQHANAAKDKDAALQLIGQFGVGFYAAFMVAERVDVHTLSMKPGSEAVVWRSSGKGTFTVAPGDRKAPGTSITLHLKDEHREFAKGWRLEDLVTKYSDFVGFPVHVGDKQANQSKALWAMPRSQVTAEQHAHLFKHLSGGGEVDEPLVTIHFSIDAPVQFHALLYVPEKPPFDLFQKERTSLRLYAKRVLIMESCEKLTPSWLRFLRGVVDSEDLTLNVSRETLQDGRTLAQIEQQLVKQVLKTLKELADEDGDRFAKFWKAFGKVLKEGATNDFKHRDAIVELCRFESLKTPPGEHTTLARYVEAMPETQKEVYYLTGLSRSAVDASPHLEAFRARGLDVLYLVDPIDEWLVQALPSYKGKKLRSVAHGDLDLGDAPSGDEPSAALDAVQAALGPRIKSARFSRRLTDSPSCLVADAGDPGANLERIMKMIDERAEERKRILELNPTHPIVKDLARVAAATPSSPELAELCELLYDQALLAEGVVEDPANLVKKLRRLMASATERLASGLPLEPRDPVPAAETAPAGASEG